jgi:hypothetical protein
VISVLCPSRGHPDLLARSVSSLRELAAVTPEILVAADDDDPGTIGAATALGTRVLVSGRAGYDRLHEYYQRLAGMARGDWLLVWNDDAVMLTPEWDAVIERLPGTVHVAGVQSPHSPLCCFPAVRREAIAAIGKFCTDNPHVDTFWGDIATAAGTFRETGVYAHCESPSGCNPHDFYSAAHQAEMARCAGILRQLAAGAA